MNIKIKQECSEDYSYEEVIVIKDDECIGRFSTSSESPEDNTCGRMDILGQVQKIIKAVNPEAVIEIS